MAAAPASPAPASSPSWQPTVEELAVACTGKALLAAPARSAKPPRPTRVFRKVGNAWTESEHYKFFEPATAQQVGCLEQVSVGGFEKYCNYIGSAAGSAEMHTTTYRISVWELRTGRLLTQRTFVGADIECPKVLAKVPARLPTEPSVEQITGLLDPFINH